MNTYRQILGIILLVTASVSSDIAPLNPSILTQSHSLSECKSCKLFINSFEKGLERTARGKYEGGDAAWEEEKLKKSYKRSDMRLIDIQDGLCRENREHSSQCHSIAEKAEEFIEEWWSQDPDKPDNLYTYICIEKMKVCCPEHHYGKDCLPCIGDHSNLCSGRGKCRGDGTRKGNGTCLCDKGYSGENCNSCDMGYFEAKQDTNICLPCHTACVDCRGVSQRDCIACKPGFLFDADDGCTDINECDDINTCKKNQFCLNSLGSYTCIACDKSCAGCHGDGPDLCRKCAKGYSKKGELCISDREGEDQSDQLTSTRYVDFNCFE